MSSPRRMDPSLRRISVVGTSCSGKSTFARELATLLRSRHVDLDSLNWGPNWTPVPAAQFQERLEEALGEERWVTSGNYTSSQSWYLSKGTAVIWLNYPFPLILWRALKRTIGRILSRETLHAGNHETFRNAFMSRNSIFLWVITSHRRRSRWNRKLFDGSEYPSLRRIELRSPTAARLFIHAISVADGSSSPHP